MMNQSINNPLTKFIFNDKAVRGFHIRLESTWQNMLSHKDYPSVILHLLGELTVATILLAGDLKSEGSLIGQIQSHGDIKLLVAEADHDNTCRATARYTPLSKEDEQKSLPELIGKEGIFALTLQIKDAEPWQGYVPLEGQNMAQMITHYLTQSQQIDSWVMLFADNEHACGLLLQRLPGNHEEDTNAWQDITLLANTIKPTELKKWDITQLIRKVFPEDDVTIFEPKNIEFTCTCSKEKVFDLLTLMNTKEIQNILEQDGNIGVSCDFCGTQYVFEPQDCVELLAMNLDDNNTQLH